MCSDVTGKNASGSRARGPSRTSTLAATTPSTSWQAARIRPAAGGRLRFAWDAESGPPSGDELALHLASDGLGIAPGKDQELDLDPDSDGPPHLDADARVRRRRGDRGLHRRDDTRLIDVDDGGAPSTMAVPVNGRAGPPCKRAAPEGDRFVVGGRDRPIEMLHDARHRRADVPIGQGGLPWLHRSWAPDGRDSGKRSQERHQFRLPGGRERRGGRAGGAVAVRRSHVPAAGGEARPVNAVAEAKGRPLVDVVGHDEDFGFRPLPVEASDLAPRSPGRRGAGADGDLQRGAGGRKRRRRGQIGERPFLQREGLPPDARVSAPEDLVRHRAPLGDADDVAENLDGRLERGAGRKREDDIAMFIQARRRGGAYLIRIFHQNGGRLTRCLLGPRLRRSRPCRGLSWPCRGLA